MGGIHFIRSDNPLTFEEKDELAGEIERAMANKGLTGQMVVIMESLDLDGFDTERGTVLMGEDLRLHDMSYAEIAALFQRLERRRFLWQRAARAYRGYVLRANDMEHARDAWEQAEAADAPDA